MTKSFWSARLSLDRTVGYWSVELTEWRVYGETDCYYYCLPITARSGFWKMQLEGGQKIDRVFIKRSGIRKVGKSGSRIAKPTKNDAVQDLIRRQRNRVRFMRADLALIESFLTETDKQTKGQTL